MILNFISAAWESLAPHSKSSSLYNTEDLKAKIRFSNKWFKNILRPLLRNWQWENYTDISANTIINFTTQALPQIKKCREKNVWNIIIELSAGLVYLRMLISRLWDNDHLSDWSAVSSSGQSPVWASRYICQCQEPNTFTVHISQTLSHLHSFQLNLIEILNMCGPLNALKYSIFFDKREETQDVRHNKYL